MVMVLGIKFILFQKCLQHILQQVQIFSLLPDAFQVFLEFVCNNEFKNSQSPPLKRRRSFF